MTTSEHLAVTREVLLDPESKTPVFVEIRSPVMQHNAPPEVHLLHQRSVLIDFLTCLGLAETLNDEFDGFSSVWAGQLNKARKSNKFGPEIQYALSVFFEGGRLNPCPTIIYDFGFADKFEIRFPNSPISRRRRRQKLDRSLLKYLGR